MFYIMISGKVRYNSIHIKFKFRQNQPMVVEIRSAILGRGQCLEEGMRELSPGVEMFQILGRWLHM